MEFLAFLPVLLFVLLPILLIGRHVVSPYMNGTKFIDPIKYPTLHRAQRVIRANNVKAREIEAKATFNRFETKRLEVTKAIDKAIEQNRKESHEAHMTGIIHWESQLRAITAEEDARKLAEEQARIAEDLRIQKAAEAELREMEMAVWTANEKARIARFKAEQEALQAEEDRRVAALLEQREKDIQALSKHHVGGKYVEENQHMFVNVHGLFIRKLPTKDSRIIDNLTQNSWVTVNGWITYESVFGNPIWFRLANGQGWIWSGGVHTQATTGLRNLNAMKEPGETFVIKSADGTICREITEPSLLQSMIDDEIAYMKLDIQAIEDKSNNITRINAGMITAEHIYAPLKKAKRTDLAKREDIPRLNRVSSGEDHDFWRGTSFESA